MFLVPTGGKATQPRPITQRCFWYRPVERLRSLDQSHSGVARVYVQGGVVRMGPFPPAHLPLRGQTFPLLPSSGDPSSGSTPLYPPPKPSPALPPTCRPPDKPFLCPPSPLLITMQQQCHVDALTTSRGEVWSDITSDIFRPRPIWKLTPPQSARLYFPYQHLLRPSLPPSRLPPS